MALVTFIELKAGTGKIQPTNLTAQAKVFTVESGALIVQLDSYGSADREIPSKQSQTLQFGEEAAHQLYRILKDTYKFQD
ncbi:hypothetical protein [uncultured Hyphomicrobium sp.]|jgi:hypothetical protein|uniref:hypothetical protein n=1 Tax=uncultured Hyphomicrobium sp. TaxID=194373 RepID=UPI0025FF247B|nr:hypothetical protein [uncultured Hyphomicrobium sp.]